MKRAVHSLAKEALTAYPKSPRTSWILQWPSQLVLNCSQVGLSPSRHQGVMHKQHSGQARSAQLWHSCQWFTASGAGCKTSQQ
jgi:hypothetical protein